MPTVIDGQWLVETETGERFTPLVGAKGGTSVPPPSAEEKALQQSQIDLIAQQKLWAQQQAEEQQALAPYLYSQMGLRRVADPARMQQEQLLTAQLQEQQKLLGSMKVPALANRAQSYTSPFAPLQRALFSHAIKSLPPEERKYFEIQDSIKAIQGRLDSLRKEPIKYTFEKMTPEELREQMSPEERQAADIRNLANERTLKALQGKLDVDESVEADIQRGQDQLRQELMKKLGPGAEGSDSWNRAMSEFDRNMNALRYSVRHGEMTTADAIATNRIGESMRRQEQALGNIHDATRNYSAASATSAGAGAGMESALSRFYGMRRDAASIAQQNAASRGAEMGGYISAGSGLVGAGIGAAAIIAV